MPITAGGVIYSVVGGLVVYSGIKGTTISATFQGALKGSLPTNDTETVNFGGTPSSSPSSPSKPSSTPSGSVPTSASVADVVGQNDSLINGTVIYKYLRSSGYTPIQAAGAVASMWGESEWNPESVGTGGCGLMGWTPVSSIQNYGGTCKAAGIGNGSPQTDMQSQLPAILKFVSANGDSGAVSLMNGTKSVGSAASIWGKQVERYGISDVHSTGISTALQIANAVDKNNGLTT